MSGFKMGEGSFSEDAREARRPAAERQLSAEARDRILGDFDFSHPLFHQEEFQRVADPDPDNTVVVALPETLSLIAKRVGVENALLLARDKSLDVRPEVVDYVQGALEGGRSRDDLVDDLELVQAALTDKLHDPLTERKHLD